MLKEFSSNRPHGRSPKSPKADQNRHDYKTQGQRQVKVHRPYSSKVNCEYSKFQIRNDYKDSIYTDRIRLDRVLLLKIAH